MDTMLPILIILLTMNTNGSKDVPVKELPPIVNNKRDWLSDKAKKDPYGTSPGLECMYITDIKLYKECIIEADQALKDLKKSR